MFFHPQTRQNRPRRAQKTLFSNDINDERQPKNDNVNAKNGYIAISGCRSLSQSPGDSVFELALVATFALGIQMLCHSSSYISVSGSAATLLFPVVRQCRSHLFGNTLIEFAKVQKTGFADRIITMLLCSHLIILIYMSAKFRQFQNNSFVFKRHKTAYTPTKSTSSTKVFDRRTFSEGWPRSL